MGRNKRMDFSDAPIAVLEADELVIAEEATQCSVSGALKRSISDPFDISFGLRLEASLEHLLWTFDENVSRGFLDQPVSDENKQAETLDKQNSTVDAIKSFWRISVAPVENPGTCSLLRQPFTPDVEDLHMADGDSVSEADFDAFAPSTDALLARQNWLGSGYHTIDNLSSSSTSLEFVKSHSQHQLEGHIHKFTVDDVNENCCEATEDDVTLESSLQQAELEAFKAGHQTIPLTQQATELWRRDLCRLSCGLLRRYVSDLDAETDCVSGQLVMCLAEREELRLLREILNEFVVLHNTLQLRRRRAADAVLARTAACTLSNRTTGGAAALRAARWGAHYSADSEKRVSLVELSHFATAAYSEGPGTNCLASSTVSLDKRQQVSRMPRGCRLSELAPLELPPLLHNAFSRLSGILQHRRAATPDSRSVLNVAAEEQPRENQPSLVKLTDSGGVHLTWKTFPNTPWPQGRPEQSLALSLQIPIPSCKLATWLPPRVRILNQILQAALYESKKVDTLLWELQSFDPLMESRTQERLSKCLSASGFESALPANSTAISLLPFQSSSFTPSSRSSSTSLRDVALCGAGLGNSSTSQQQQQPRKTVTFDWRGTKEHFKVNSTPGVDNAETKRSDVVL